MRLRMLILFLLSSCLKAFNQLNVKLDSISVDVEAMTIFYFTHSQLKNNRDIKFKKLTFSLIENIERECSK